MFSWNESKDSAPLEKVIEIRKMSHYWMLLYLLIIATKKIYARSLTKPKIEGIALFWMVLKFFTDLLILFGAFNFEFSQILFIISLVVFNPYNKKKLFIQSSPKLEITGVPVYFSHFKSCWEKNLNFQFQSHVTSSFQSKEFSVTFFIYWLLTARIIMFKIWFAWILWKILDKYDNFEKVLWKIC